MPFYLTTRLPAFAFWRLWPALLVFGLLSVPLAKGATTEFPSAGGITINDNANGAPYPSTLTVSGVTGVVTAVRVKINGFTHAFPDDVDVFLMAPGGQVSSVFSDAGGSTSVTGVNLVFDDAAGAVIPNSGAITSGTYLPANFSASEPLPPGGTGSIGTSLTTLAGSGVNGVWKLFVTDDLVTNSGSITTWALVIETGTPAPELSIEQPLGTPLINASQSSFASQSPGTTSAAKTYTITNAGTAALTLSGVSITGSNSSEFSLSTAGMLSSIPAGSQTTFAVTFSPADAGFRSATLRVLSNDADEGTTDITLFGQSAYSGPKIAIEQPAGTALALAATVPFGEQSITTTSVAKTFVIKNSGSTALSITGVSTTSGNSGEFVVSTTGMLSSVPAFSQTTFSVMFSPTALGTRTTTLRVLSNDSSAGTFDITLTGTGTPPPPAHELVTSFAVPPQDPGYGALVAGGDGYFWGVTENGGVFGVGTIYKVKADGSDWQTVLSFTGVTQGGNGPTNEGYWPQGGLIHDGAGYLWGTTESGGGYIEGNTFYGADGTIFKVQVSTGVLTTVARFNPATATDSIGASPYAGLAADGQGNFWGTTTRAGASNCGTVYKVNATTGVITTVAEFTGQTGTKKGAKAMGVLLNDGAGHFWGTTSEGGASNYGTVFKVNINTGAFSTVVEFGAVNKGASPIGGLVNDGAGFLWGTTRDGGPNAGSAGSGTIFKVNTSSGVLTTVVVFTDQGASNRGSHPSAGLVSDGTGSFWGTTYQGADSGGGSVDGTVFKVNASTGVLTSLAEFTFAETSHKGFMPRAGLVSDGAGFFWGTTSHGGKGDRGTVFKVNASSGVLSTMVEFGGDSTYRPDGRLVSDSAGNLWGATEQGGLTSGAGTIYKVNPNTGVRTTIVEFGGYGAGTNGGAPNGGLVSDGAGFLWGTTYRGGTNGSGTVFKINPGTGGLSTVIHFGVGNDAAGPAAGLMNDGAGFLWGTTQQGGVNGNGIVFKVNASTGAFTKVAEFTKNGTSSGPPNPLGELISDGAGYVWGTTEGNLNNSTDYGTVYKVNVSTGVLTTVVAFTGTTGSNPGRNPACALVNDGAGFLWGTTSGVSINSGTIFKVAISSGALTNLANAATPKAGLVNDGTGFLWGTTASGGGYYGSVFKVNSSTGAAANVVSFTGIAGLVPGDKPWHGALLKHSDGNFYGTTSERGAGGGGTLFRLRFGPSTVTQPATAVSNTSATLNGSINPNGAATTADFEWGTSPTLVTFNSLSAGTIAYGTTPVAVSATLSGLTTGNTYYYRTKGLNVNNSTPQRGVIMSFVVALTPSIVMEHPTGNMLADGVSSVDFGHSLIGVGTARVLTIRNTGAAQLTSLALTKDGSNAGDFNVGSLGATTLAPGASTTFTIVFSPAASGNRSAALHVASNVTGATNPFDIVLTGIGGTAQTEAEKWRLLWFGTSSNMGNAADSATPQNDNIPNLLKFATGMNPAQSGRMPGTAAKSGSNLLFTYPRSKTALGSGVTYTVEWSDTLAGGSWSNTGVIENAVDQGSTDQVTATMPAGSNGHRFVHLRVTPAP